MKIGDVINKALVGKKLEHINKYDRKVVLEIESFIFEVHSREITPSTQENDWWGESAEWTTYAVNFVDGSSIEISFDEDLKFFD